MFNGYNETPLISYNEFDQDEKKQENVPKWSYGQGTGVQPHNHNRQPEYWPGKSNFLGVTTPVHVPAKCNCCYSSENTSYQGESNHHRPWLPRLSITVNGAGESCKLPGNHQWENIGLPHQESCLVESNVLAPQYLHDNGGKHPYYRHYQSSRLVDHHQPGVITSVKSSTEGHIVLKQKDEISSNSTVQEISFYGQGGIKQPTLCNAAYDLTRNMDIKRLDDRSCDVTFCDFSERYSNADSYRHLNNVTTYPTDQHISRSQVVEPYMKTVPLNLNQNRVPSTGHRNLRENIPKPSKAFDPTIVTPNAVPRKSDLCQTVNNEKNCRVLYQSSIPKDSPGPDTYGTSVAVDLKNNEILVDYSHFNLNRELPKHYDNLAETEMQKKLLFDRDLHVEYYSRNNLTESMKRTGAIPLQNNDKDCSLNQMSQVNYTQQQQYNNLNRYNQGGNVQKYVEMGNQKPSVTVFHPKEFNGLDKVTKPDNCDRGQENPTLIQRPENLLKNENSSVHARLTRPPLIFNEPRDLRFADRVQNSFPYQSNPATATNFIPPEYSHPSHNVSNRFEYPHPFVANGFQGPDTAQFSHRSTTQRMPSCNNPNQSFASPANNTFGFDSYCQHPANSDKTYPQQFYHGMEQINMTDIYATSRQKSRMENSSEFLKKQNLNLEGIKSQELGKNGGSKMSPLRLLRKKKFNNQKNDTINKSPVRVQNLETTPTLDVRKFWSTWADEEEENAMPTQMVVLDCQNIDPEQAKLFQIYESDPVRALNLENENVAAFKDSRYDKDPINPPNGFDVNVKETKENYEPAGVIKKDIHDVSQDINENCVKQIATYESRKSVDRSVLTAPVNSILEIETKKHTNQKKLPIICDNPLDDAKSDAKNHPKEIIKSQDAKEAPGDKISRDQIINSCPQEKWTEKNFSTFKEQDKSMELEMLRNTENKDAFAIKKYSFTPIENINEKMEKQRGITVSGNVNEYQCKSVDIENCKLTDKFLVPKSDKVGNEKVHLLPGDRTREEKEHQNKLHCSDSNLPTSEYRRNKFLNYSDGKVMVNSGNSAICCNRETVKTNNDRASPKQVTRNVIVERSDNLFVSVEPEKEVIDKEVKQDLSSKSLRPLLDVYPSEDSRSTFHRTVNASTHSDFKPKEETGLQHFEIDDILQKLSKINFHSADVNVASVVAESTKNDGKVRMSKSNSMEKMKKTKKSEYKQEDFGGGVKLQNVCGSKPTIKFSIQKSHDLKISFKVLNNNNNNSNNTSHSSNSTDSNAKLHNHSGRKMKSTEIEPVDVTKSTDMITLKLKNNQDHTNDKNKSFPAKTSHRFQKGNMRKKKKTKLRLKDVAESPQMKTPVLKIKKSRYMRMFDKDPLAVPVNYDHCLHSPKTVSESSFLSDDFQVQESVDSAKIKLTFKRQKANSDSEYKIQGGLREVANPEIESHDEKKKSDTEDASSHNLPNMEFRCSLNLDEGNKSIESNHEHQEANQTDFKNVNAGDKEQAVNDNSNTPLTLHCYVHKRNSEYLIEGGHPFDTNEIEGSFNDSKEDIVKNETTSIANPNKHVSISNSAFEKSKFVACDKIEDVNGSSKSNELDKNNAELISNEFINSEDYGKPHKKTSNSTGDSDPQNVIEEETQDLGSCAIDVKDPLNITSPKSIENTNLTHLTKFSDGSKDIPLPDDCRNCERDHIEASPEFFSSDRNSTSINNLKADLLVISPDACSPLTDNEIEIKKSDSTVNSLLNDDTSVNFPNNNDFLTCAPTKEEETSLLNANSEVDSENHPKKESTVPKRHSLENIDSNKTCQNLSETEQKIGEDICLGNEKSELTIHNKPSFENVDYEEGNDTPSVVPLFKSLESENQNSNECNSQKHWVDPFIVHSCYGSAKTRAFELDLNGNREVNGGDNCDKNVTAASDDVNKVDKISQALEAIFQDNITHNENKKTVHIPPKRDETENQKELVRKDFLTQQPTPKKDDEVPVKDDQPIQLGQSINGEVEYDNITNSKPSLDGDSGSAQTEKPNLNDRWCEENKLLSSPIAKETITHTINAKTTNIEINLKENIAINKMMPEVYSETDLSTELLNENLVAPTTSKFQGNGVVDIENNKVSLNAIENMRNDIELRQALDIEPSCARGINKEISNASDKIREHIDAVERPALKLPRNIDKIMFDRPLKIQRRHSEKPEINRVEFMSRVRSAMYQSKKASKIKFTYSQWKLRCQKCKSCPPSFKFNRHETVRVEVPVLDIPVEDIPLPAGEPPLENCFDLLDYVKKRKIAQKEMGDLKMSVFNVITAESSDPSNSDTRTPFEKPRNETSLMEGTKQSFASDIADLHCSLLDVKTIKSNINFLEPSTKEKVNGTETNREVNKTEGVDIQNPNFVGSAEEQGVGLAHDRNSDNPKKETKNLNKKSIITFSSVGEPITSEIVFGESCLNKCIEITNKEVCQNSPNIALINENKPFAEKITHKNEYDQNDSRHAGREEMCQNDPHGKHDIYGHRTEDLSATKVTPTSREDYKELDLRPDYEEPQADLMPVEDINLDEIDADEKVKHATGGESTGETSFENDGFVKNGFYECEDIPTSEDLPNDHNIEVEKVSDDDKFRHMMQNCLDNAKKFLNVSNLKLFSCSVEDLLELDCQLMASSADDRETEKSTTEPANHISRDVLLTSCEEITGDDLELSQKFQPLDMTMDFVPSFETENSGNLCPEILPVDNWPYLEEEVLSSPANLNCNETDIVPILESSASALVIHSSTKHHEKSSLKNGFPCDFRKVVNKKCVSRSRRILNGNFKRHRRSFTVKDEVKTSKQNEKRRKTMDGLDGSHLLQTSSKESDNDRNEKITNLKNEVDKIEQLWHSAKDLKCRLSLQKIENRENCGENVETRSDLQCNSHCFCANGKNIIKGIFENFNGHKIDNYHSNGFNSLNASMSFNAENDYKSPMWQPKVMLFRISKKQLRKIQERARIRIDGKRDKKNDHHLHKENTLFRENSLQSTSSVEALGLVPAIKRQKMSSNSVESSNENKRNLESKHKRDRNDCFKHSDEFEKVELSGNRTQFQAPKINKCVDSGKYLNFGEVITDTKASKVDEESSGTISIAEPVIKRKKHRFRNLHTRSGSNSRKNKYHSSKDPSSSAFNLKNVDTEHVLRQMFKDFDERKEKFLEHRRISTVVEELSSADGINNDISCTFEKPNNFQVPVQNAEKCSRENDYHGNDRYHCISTARGTTTTTITSDSSLREKNDSCRKSEKGYGKRSDSKETRTYEDSLKDRHRYEESRSQRYHRDSRKSLSERSKRKHHDDREKVHRKNEFTAYKTNNKHKENYFSESNQRKESNSEGKSDIEESVDLKAIQSHDSTESLTNGKSIAYREVSPERPWTCEVCGYSNVSERIVHIKGHPFHCQSCHLAFRTEARFVNHLTKKHKDIRNQHHCLLCELSFDTENQYQKHLETREHKHLETVEKNTINTLFTLLTGQPCPVLGLVEMKPEWLPNQAGTVHFYHQATPLSLALQYLKMHHDLSSYSTETTSHSN